MKRLRYVPLTSDEIRQGLTTLSKSRDYRVMRIARVFRQLARGSITSRMADIELTMLANTIEAGKLCKTVRDTRARSKKTL